MSKLEPIKTYKLADHLFRHQSGQVVASLCRKFGFHNVELIEDAFQETLLKALQQWRYKGIPHKPESWLYKVCQNTLLDKFKQQQTRVKHSDALKERIKADKEKTDIVQNEEDLLALIFTCCDQSISKPSQIALTLKLACGLSVNEIALALLEKKESVERKINRAIHKLKDQNIQIVNLSNIIVDNRLNSVLEILYMLFNEGYMAHGGENLIKIELAAESLRLSRILVKNKSANRPVVHALCALICFQSARFPSRTAEGGTLVILEDQDRSLWDRDLLLEGAHQLREAGSGNEITEYHLYAGIAASHSLAKTYEETDFKQIVRYYDQLKSLNSSPIILLNRGVAIAMAVDIETGLNEILELKSIPMMNRYHLFHSTVADLYRRIENYDEAIKYYESAIELSVSDAERKFLQMRVEECEERR